MKLGRFTAGLVACAVALPAAAEAPQTARVVVHVDRPGAVIRPELHGQFAEHLGRSVYDGVWVGEDSAIPNIRGFRKDVVEALKAIHVPVLRWPGGCFADDYHWRDGVGPRAKRPGRINSVWGGVLDTNAFGTHEFMDFASLIGAKPYLAANVGTGSPHEMAEWIEYVTSASQSSLANERRGNGRQEPWPLDYLGVGNETWGCGGNMRPEFYADLFRQFATFVRPQGGAKIVKVASGASADDLNWTEVMLSRSAAQMDAYSMHYYTVQSGNWSHKGSATRFGEGEWIASIAGALKLDDWIRKHAAIMDKYDPKQRVGLYVDEWGNWFDAEPGESRGMLFQQNSLRDALTAAMSLDVLQSHADRVRMANIAQMVNVLQATILTDKDRMVLTPTYHVFHMYQVFQGATSLPADVEAPEYRVGEVAVPGLHVSAARNAAGVVQLALVNPDPHAGKTVDVRLAGQKPRRVTGRVLTAPETTSINAFDAPAAVKPAPFAGAKPAGDGLAVEVPAKSVVVLSVE